MKNTKAEIKDTELNKVNGGIFIVFASDNSPVADPVPLTPEYKKVTSERNVLIPIPY